MDDFKKPPVLSVCMIVKNEENFLPDCLESVKTVADELIVVDTGSVDKTVEIAKSFGAIIKYFEWIDDFSAARNESIKYATGKWVLWLDADERLTKESIPHLKQIIQTNQKSFYKIHITNKTKSGTTESDAHRLFRNVKGVRFEGRIHEQIYQSCVNSGLKQKDTAVRLYHLGYDQNEVDSKNKSERNLNLLKKLVEDSPNSSYAHFTLGQCYSLRGDDEKAIQHFEKSYELKNMSRPLTGSLYNCLADSYFNIGKIDKAVEFADKSIKLISKQIGGYVLHYKIFDKQDQHDKAILNLNRVLNFLEYFKTHPKTISTDVTLPVFMVHKSKGESYLKLEKFKQAVESFRKSWETSPDKSASLLKKFTELAVNHSDLENACFGLEEMRQRDMDTIQVLDLLGITYIKLNNMSKAINAYEELLEFHPGNEQVKRRLAALHVKTGNHDKAQELLAG